NQRAILHFRNEDYEKSIQDCERALERNPYHFGALSGMAECYVNLRRPRAALKAYRQAYRINPNLGGVEETIKSLEEALGACNEAARTLSFSREFLRALLPM